MGLHIGPLAVAAFAGSIANSSVLAVEAISDPSVTSYVGAGSSALMASVILLVFRSLMTGSLVVRQSVATEEALKKLVADGAERERQLHDLVNRIGR